MLTRLFSKASACVHILCLVAAILTSPGSLAQPVKFKKHTYFYSINEPTKLETTDLNGDNIKDIVSTSRNGIIVLNSDPSGH